MASFLSGLPAKVRSLAGGVVAVVRRAAPPIAVVFAFSKANAVAEQLGDASAHSVEIQKRAR